MNLKKILSLFLALLLLTTTVFASGTNMNGSGGGGMETVSGNSYWPSGQDGLRVTVLYAGTCDVYSGPFDLTKVQGLNGKKGVAFFQKKSKLDYIAGTQLEKAESGETYQCIIANGLPSIVSSNGKSNIGQIRNYFIKKTDQVASNLGMTPQELTSGDYTLLVEPIAYFYLFGDYWAMTATEVAMYNKQTPMVGGRDVMNIANMKNLTHKNLPISLYLQEEEFGISPWTGSTTDFIRDDDLIINYLGVGAVTFEGGTPVIDAPDYIYRVNTKVITAATIRSGSDITTDDNAKATFVIPTIGTKYSRQFVVEGGSSQVVWVEWTTPSKPTTMEISVSTSDGTAIKTKIKVEIVDEYDQIPPDPRGEDTNTGIHSEPDVPSLEEAVTSRSWDIWTCKKVPKESSSGGGSSTPDEGPNGRSGRASYTPMSRATEYTWEYEKKTYTATLNKPVVKIKPAQSNPTARGSQMKSGYGIEISARTSVSGNGAGSATGAQSLVTRFPEFEYKNYDRLLESPQSGGLSVSNWAFAVNVYSMKEDPVHFTPVWYPDDVDYLVAVEVRDVWTPDGELRTQVESNSLDIYGTVFDDWYVRRSR